MRRSFASVKEDRGCNSLATEFYSHNDESDELTFLDSVSFLPNGREPKNMHLMRCQTLLVQVASPLFITLFDVVNNSRLLYFQGGEERTVTS